LDVFTNKLNVLRESPCNIRAVGNEKISTGGHSGRTKMAVLRTPNYHQNRHFRPILLKTSQIGISRNSAKSTPLLKVREDCRERLQEEATGPKVPFSGTPRQTLHLHCAIRYFQVLLEIGVFQQNMSLAAIHHISTPKAQHHTSRHSRRHLLPPFFNSAWLIQRKAYGY